MAALMNWLDRHGIVTIAMVALMMAVGVIYVWLVVHVTLALLENLEQITMPVATFYGALLGGPALFVTILAAGHNKWMERLKHGRHKD